VPAAGYEVIIDTGGSQNVSFNLVYGQCESGSYSDCFFSGETRNYYLSPGTYFLTVEDAGFGGPFPGDR
jgi:hypothetical protein